MILPSARMMLASVLKSMVRYGRDQSPGKPGEKFTAAEFRAKCREYAAEQIDGQRKDFIRLGATFSSIGKPWQSQPGTYGESKPVSPLDLTIMSFRILLTADRRPA
jgi:hypothetical protein